MKHKIMFMIPSQERKDIYIKSVFVGVLKQCDVKSYGIEVVALDKGRMPRFDPQNRKESCVILMGFTIEQEKMVCAWLKQQEMQFIVVNGEDTVPNALNKVKANTREPFRRIAQSLIAQGRQKMAYVGYNPFSDTDRGKLQGVRDAFADAGLVFDERGIFYYSGNMAELVHVASESIEGYDSILCTNDYAAVCLLKSLKEKGIKIPEDVALTSYDNLHIGQHSNPLLTTVDPSYNDMGVQAVCLATLLLSQPDLVKIHIVSPYNIIERESAVLNLGDNKENLGDLIEDTSHNGQFINIFFTDDSIKELQNIESILYTMDSTDRRILEGIKEGKKISAISEELNYKSETIKYRLHKIYKHFDCKDRQELVSLLNHHL